MSGIFFDSSTLISMAVTCSLPILRKLKQAYDGDFFITDAVYQETVGKAMQSLRFRYEGYRLKELIEDGTIKTYPDAGLQNQIRDLMNSMNRTYLVNGKPLTIVQLGEISTTIACLKEKADLIALDERTTRLLIENPDSLKPWLENKLHTNISINKENEESWRSLISDKFIPMRSTEFAIAAWEKGFFGENHDVLFGLLWALKFAGCAISEEEIDFYMKKTA